MLIHEYKCMKCGNKTEAIVKTSDITGNKGIVDSVELTKRVKALQKENEVCSCGGKRVKLMTNNPPIFFDRPIHAKISQRYL